MRSPSDPLTRRDLLRAGAVGAAGTAAGAATPVAAQENESGGGGGSVRPDFGGYTEDAKGGTYEDMRGSSEVTVEVGGGSSGLAFLPTEAWIDTGTTVTFEWVSDGHNVVPESVPDGAGWEGEETVENTGYAYEHTFGTGGIYTYFCRPHKGLGMLGAIAVGDGVPTVSVGGSGEAPGVVLPGSAKTLVVGGVGLMVSTLSLAFFFMKYGGDYETDV